MTRSIKALAPKPSDAIKAMIQGLKTLPNETFKIRMSTFGQKALDNKTCFGCAATCAVHLLAEKPPSFEHILQTSHSDYLGFDEGELGWFESAVDEFRVGKPKELLSGFYGDVLKELSLTVLRELTAQQDWYLTTGNWEWQIPKIEEYVEKLIALGL